MRKMKVWAIFTVTVAMATNSFAENNVKNETQTIAVSSAEQNGMNLGLPSGTRWAEANLGAESETDPGLYYAWGDTNGYTKDSGHEFSIGAYHESDSYPHAIFNNINITRDAANKRLGGSWRMPTAGECQELLDNCTRERIKNYNGTGINGRLFTSKINGNTLFMPDCGYCDYSTLYEWGDFGYYWCSSYDRSTSRGYVFDTALRAIPWGRARRNGCPIRAVCE